MRNSLLIMAFFLGLSSITLAQDPQDSTDPNVAPLTSFAALSVNIKRNPKELVTFHCRKTSEFECIQTLTEEIPAMVCSTTPFRPRCPEPQWTRKTINTIQGHLSSVDFSTLDQAYSQLQLNKIANMDLKKDLPEFEANQTWIIILARTIDGKVWAYKAELSQLGKDTDKVTPFMQTIQEMATHLK